jgi:hypothetical protein
VVVRLAAALWRGVLGASRQVCFGVVLLAGNGGQCAQFGGVPWMPGWLQMQGIEALLWDSELRSIGIQPQQRRAGAAMLNTEFVPTSFLPTPGLPLGAPSKQGQASAAVLNNQFEQSPSAELHPNFAPLPTLRASHWSSASDQNTFALPAAQAANPTTGLGDATVPAARGAFALRRLPVAKAIDEAYGDIQVLCDAQLSRLLRAGGQFWSRQAVSAPPAQFAQGEFGASPFPNPEPLGDPAFTPSANRPNLIPPSLAGAWCRPPPVPFAQTSPLATYAFWTPCIFLFAAAMVLWMSRGVTMPRL